MVVTSDTALTARFLEVDAARLLLVIWHFAIPPTDMARSLRCWPSAPVSRVLAREYHLQKLDFLLRNPSYLAYELIELHSMGEPSATDAESVMADVRSIIQDGEPERHTDPFRRFWRGAYENIDDVKSWWYAHDLVYTEIEPRAQYGGEATPVTYFFLTPEGENVAERLVARVEAAKWYDKRLQLIHRYFKAITPARLKQLQYSHTAYRDAQLNEMIPDLTRPQINETFQRVFGQDMEMYYA